MAKRFSIVCSTHSLAGSANKTNSDFIVTAPEIGLFVMCSGVGEKNSAEPVAQNAAQSILSTLTKAAKQLEQDSPSGSQQRGPRSGLSVQQIQLLIEQAIHRASHALFEQAEQARTRSRRYCTLDLLWLIGNRIFTAHVGNGRIYQARKSGLERLTEDHSYIAQLVKKGHSLESAEKLPYSDTLERCLGKDPLIEIDLGIFEVMAGERIILASNGLFRTWKEEQINQVLANPELSPKKILHRIFHSPDNASVPAQFEADTSVIIISIAEPNTEKPLEGVPTDLPVDRKFAAMKNVEFFQPLSYKDISTILSIAETREYPMGTLLMKEGDVPSEFWILLSGTVEVFIEGSPNPIVCEETKGKCLGESGILGKPKRRATIRAKTKLTALRIDTRMFDQLLKRDLAFGFRVMNAICSILSDRTDALNHSLAKNS